MPARRPRERLLTLAATAIALLGAAGSAHAAGFAPAAARDLGAVPRSSTVHASVALAARDPAGLAAYARAVSTSGSPDYHRYLSVGAFRRRFAPSSAQVRAVRARLRARGLTLGSVTANGLSIPVRAPAAVATAAFDTAIHRYALRGGSIADATTGPARLGGRVDHLVQGVVGLDAVAPSASVVIRPRAVPPARTADALAADAPIASSAAAASSAPSAHATHATHAATTTAAGPQACSAARSSATANGSHTAAQIAAAYGLSNFWAAGDEGRGVTIALYELEPFSPADIAAYQSCYGTNANVLTEAIDGGAGSGPGSGEAAMDVEDLIGLAPQATIRVYEGSRSGVGAYDTYSRIVSDDAAQVVSTSWGLCESRQGAVAAAAESTLFQEAAVQGQSVIAASGDLGADDCADNQHAVDDPAAQPWVTAVGATSLRGSQNTVWDNGLGASGGGASQIWGEPAYQATAAPPQSAVTCAGSGSSCRQVPDVSLDGDPDTGYTTYFQGGWRAAGGTSIAAPTFAALAALADGSPACAGRSLGFLNPSLYGAAATAYPADFHDVIAGSNTFGSVLGFAAGPGYDMASGLGTPTSGLGPALCHDAVAVTAPATQRWTTARAVSLALRGSSALGARMTWSATGLPGGVGVDPASGRISGAPTATGRFTVIVTAVDADGATASASFAAAVTRAATTAGRPSAGSGSRAGSRAGRHGSTATPAAQTIELARLRDRAGHVGAAVHLRLTARHADGLALRFSARGLPRGLALDRRTGVIAGRPRAAGARTVTVRVAAAHGRGATATFRWIIVA